MIMDISEQIRQVARNLLKEEKVDLVIGFEQGSLALHTTPCFIRHEEEAGRLIWNSFCANNVATHLVKRQDRVAIVAKGCDSRAVVELIKEKQIRREQLTVIGVPCQGMVDSGRIEAELGGNEVLEVEEKGESLLLKGKGFTSTLDREAYLYPCCDVCTHRNPVICDILIGDTVEERAADEYNDVAAFESRSVEDRWEYFSQEVSKCIRCYACRNACPLCYCPECFVDKTRPQWIGKTINISDTQIFHLTRAFHLAGRCVGCGACERACPVGVDIRALNRKLVMDVDRLFGYKAGTSLDELAPLTTFKPEDPEGFMLNP